ncbi:MAG: PstS family phosphate ABC transporter substrate-binding protein [Deltaproteobacteria bacterium]|nr:PstS family phosphate ABC transporter substrate-binding protein [Deltaproteobacteria bacterium]
MHPLLLSLVLGACGEPPTEAVPPPQPVSIDGSSTVYPITEAVAEAFRAIEPDVRVTIGVSGSGGGFKKFCSGEIVLAGASRPIKKSEVDACAAKGIAFVELPVAYDGIAVVAHPTATWLDDVTVEELKAMWQPEAQGTVTRWAQIRADWPDRPFHLFGPGVDSGTYDYFTAAIVGTEHSSRGDFTPSEDDNVLVQGVATDPDALGFFGLAWYEENHDRLRLVPVEDGKPDNGAGPIAPSMETVRNGTYQPLSRPLFLYVASSALDRPEVARFLSFYLKDGRALVSEVGYVPLSDVAYELVQKRLAARTSGSVFVSGGSQVGLTVEGLLGKER